MNTDYNLYKIFLYLFEEKSISKTANKLYVSQPAISYSLKELESQLGYTLFHRNSKGIEPTMEAKELYNYVSHAFHILNDAEEHIKNLNDLTVGSIRIGIAPYLDISYLSDMIVEFHNGFPGIQFEIISRSMDEMVEMLQTRRLDLIVGFSLMSSKNDITRDSLMKVSTCFVYDKEAYGKVEIKKLADLEKYPILLPSITSPLRAKVDDFAKNHTIKMKTMMECDNYHYMLEMVRKGCGIGFFIKDVIDKECVNDSLETVPCVEELPIVDVGILYMNDFLTTATLKFIELLKKRMKV